MEGAPTPEAVGRRAAGPPLIAGRIHGVRIWSLAWTPDGDVALCGFLGHEWEAGGRATRAECGTSGGRGCERSPDPSCGCGLYGRHPSAGAERHLSVGLPEPSDGVSPSHEPQVAGVVEAWGRVELHAEGFRAEYARPVALLLPDGCQESDYGALVGRLADRYGARMLCFSDPAGLVAHCKHRNLGLAEETVRSLLREPPAPDHSPPALTPATEQGGARRGRIRELWEECRPDGIGDALGMLAAGVLGLFYLAVGASVAFTIVAAIFGWFPEDGERRAGARGESAKGGGALHGGPSLRVVDEELVSEGKARWLYLAEVRNTGDRAAIGVVPAGRLLDHRGERLESIDQPKSVEGEANLAPGQTGVVWDSIRLRGPKRRPVSAVERMDVTAAAASLVDGPNRTPVAVRRVRFDRELCIVTATIDSRRRMLRARLQLVGRTRKGNVLGASEFGVGPVSPRRSEYFVTRVPPAQCTGRFPRVGGYASLTRRQLLGSGRG